MGDHIVWGKVDDSDSFHDSFHGSDDNVRGGASRLAGIIFKPDSSEEGSSSFRGPSGPAVAGVEEKLALAGVKSDMHIIDEDEFDDEPTDAAQAAMEANPEMIEKILAQIGFWSKGSSRHAQGRCKPCHYVYGRVGCANGQDCGFCHFPHTDKSRKRIGMSKRQYCKTVANALRDYCKENPDMLAEVLRQASLKSSYLNTIAQEREPPPEPRPAGSFPSSSAGGSPRAGAPSTSSASSQPPFMEWPTDTSWNGKLAL
mmetsp:Transcript_76077/g.219702  ORF Transcript_76077/g.219702 Transcript_76077/m.219702 type:complete len:257 (-) Transcript_76077:159-929(-)